MVAADPRLQAVSLQVSLIINLAVRYTAITFRQACSYLHSRRASLPLGRYQIILLRDRGVNNLPKGSAQQHLAGKQIINLMHDRKSNALLTAIIFHTYTPQK